MPKEASIHTLPGDARPRGHRNGPPDSAGFRGRRRGRAPPRKSGDARGERTRTASVPPKNVSLGDGHFQVMLLETLQSGAQGRRLIGEHDRVVHIEGGIFTVPEGMARQDIHFMLTAGM